MKIISLIDEDFINYKEPSMFIGMPYCSGKCDHEAGITVCQNSTLQYAEILDTDTRKLVNRFLNNPITHAVVFGVREPMDSFEDLFEFISILRETDDSDVCVYTGYWPGEIEDKVEQLKQFKNIIIKYGRFKPNQKQRLDPILGVMLYEPQWAERIS